MVQQLGDLLGQANDIFQQLQQQMGGTPPGAGKPPAPKAPPIPPGAGGNPAAGGPPGGGDPSEDYM
jgi:hypothetical protein